MSLQVDRKEFLFLTALVVYLSELMIHLTVFADNTEFMSALKYVRYFCYLLAVIKILMDCYGQKSLYKICIIIVLVAISVLQVGDRTYLFYLLMFIAAKDINFRKIIKCSCFVQGAFLVFFVLGSQIGLLINYLFVQEGGRNRYGLGFFYAALAPTVFFFFMMSYIYLRKEQMRIYEYLILEIINVWFYFMTDTRACFYLSTVLLIFVFIVNIYRKHKPVRIKKNGWLLVMPALCCMGAVVLNAFYNSENSIWLRLNQLLNGRLRLGLEAINAYGITLFGQNITWSGDSMWRLTGAITEEYNYVDSSYVQLLLNYGIVFLILVIVAYTYMMYMAIKMHDFYLQTILLAIVIFSITEPRLFNLAYNPFPFLVAGAWRTKSLENLNCKENLLIRKWIL